MPDTPSTADLDARLTELEIKLGFMDDLVESLNDQMARQQQVIELLKAEVLRLRDQVQDAPSAGYRSLRDEIPPHY